eukprot:TRINITY_DN17272_c0_g1_i1.p2 TRINITY_DN17272_c0_g1~~TRINITY_DN17272_c0_g1_i1.p2  ORF type:complete len:53 (+),score=10.55 TRINITY_DN17272_c0_g1_i1:495-653(+)
MTSSSLYVSDLCNYDAIWGFVFPQASEKKCDILRRTNSTRFCGTLKIFFLCF